LEELGLFSAAAAALARHWSESDEPARAVDPALLAADYAQRRLSYDEAAALQRLAVQAAPAARVAELALGLGRLEAAAGRHEEAMQAFADAADAASPNEGTLLGAAAVGYEDALFASRRVRGFDGDRSVELLTAAGEALGAVPTAISAQVHAALARALAYRGDPTAPARSEAAVGLARGCGDPAVRAYALLAWRAAREGPEWLAARRERAPEMIEASVAAGDDALTNEVQRLALVDDLAAGDVVRADAAIAELSSRIERLRRADQAWYPPMWRGLRSLWSGDLEGAADAAEAFRHEGRRVGYPAVDQVYGLQLYLVRRRQGRADEVAPLFARLTERVGERWWAMAASLAVETGDLASARRILGELCIERSLPVGLAFAPAVALLVDALEAVGHGGLSETLRPMLAAWSGQFAIVGAGAVSLGPADLALGRLARIAGDDRAARAHFTAARRLALAASSPFDADDAAQALAALT
jgi:tetratricopeptide (TPR) repeat protein